MLKIENLCVKTKNKTILDNLSCEFLDGKIYVLMGKNGSGKSTLTNTIVGYDDLEKTGSIKYNDIEIINKSMTDIARLGIYKVSQNPIEIEGVSNSHMLRCLLNEKNNEKVDIFKFNNELNEICDKLELDRSFIHKDINVSASGGERKKIELMHMWIIKPSLIILDEVDSGLDVDAVKVVSNNILEYYKKYKPTIIIITHDNRLIKNFDDYFVYLLSDNKISKSGNKDLVIDILNEGF